MPSIFRGLARRTFSCSRMSFGVLMVAACFLYLISSAILQLRYVSDQPKTYSPTEKNVKPVEREEAHKVVRQEAHKVEKPRVITPSNVVKMGVKEKYSAANMDRIVHFDLKGAPPNLAYIQQLFPKLKEWGATGLLMEYEDMFPYWGDLQVLARPEAYNKTTIQTILKLAEQNNLIVIPLVQTFGHFEFVLKHDKFKHLREVPDQIKNLNPALPESLQVVYEMIDQIVSLHPDSKYIHIGSDEVYYLGRSRESQNLMADQKIGKNGLFLYHATNVLKYVKKSHPEVQAIMWDDMLRQIERVELQECDFKRYQGLARMETFSLRYHTLILDFGACDVSEKNFIMAKPVQHG